MPHPPAGTPLPHILVIILLSKLIAKTYLGLQGRHGDYKIEPRVKQILTDHLFLYAITTMASTLNLATLPSQSEYESIEKIIIQESQTFHSWLKKLQLVCGQDRNSTHASE